MTNDRSRFARTLFGPLAPQIPRKAGCSWVLPSRNRVRHSAEATATILHPVAEVSCFSRC